MEVSTVKLHEVPMTDHLLSDPERPRDSRMGHDYRDYSDRIPKGIRARMRDRRY